MNAQDKPSIPSSSQEAIIDVPAAKMQIVYPKGASLSDLEKQPHISHAPDSRGSFISVDFYLGYADIAIQEIVFHSLESCKAFEAQYIESEDDESGIPEDWYSSKLFIQERKAFESNKLLKDFVFINRVKYRQACWYDTLMGYYKHENTTFVGNLRVKIIIFSDYECEKIVENVNKLLAKIKFVKMNN